MAEEKRQPIDFNNMEPPQTVTNPDVQGKGYREYPRHMHHEDGSFVEVKNDKQKAVAKKKGYTEAPTHPQWTDHGKKPVALDFDDED